MDRLFLLPLFLLLMVPLYAPRTNSHWRYTGKHATQYWIKKNPHEKLNGLISGRFTYWASEAPIPGGISIENFELKSPLLDHYNPQRPTYACGEDGGLLLCSWPKGRTLSLPFVYSNEVWTGIEYQVASHLMLKGEIEKGLEIVRVCRDRYDGSVRNPFNPVRSIIWFD